MKSIAIIPAAGEGKRFGSTLPKQFTEILDIPVFIRTLLAFENSDDIDSVVLCVNTNWRDYTVEKLEEFKIKKVAAIVNGGLQRQDSIFNALETDTVKNADIIVTHDAVRPFVSPQLIANIIDAADEYGAAVAAIPVVTNLKETIDRKFIFKSHDSSNFVYVQTPQAFKRGLFTAAYEYAMQEMIYAVDDSELIEHNKSNTSYLYNYKVKVVEGDYTNIKINTRFDIKIAETILRDQQLSFITNLE